LNCSAYITTSWDDGHPLDLRIAELLTKYGLRGTFYVPRISEHGTMSAGQIRQLSASFEIGAHTVHHLDLTQTRGRVARDEIFDSKYWIEQITGRPCVTFCPPLGRYHQHHLELIRDAGFLAMRSVEFLSLDFPRRCARLLVMPTTLQAYPHGPMAFIRNAVWRGALRNLWLYIVHGAACEWNHMAELIMRHTLENGGVFHLWGHSWELEETAQWSRLDGVLQMLAEIRSSAMPLTNAQLCQTQLLPSSRSRRAERLGLRQAICYRSSSCDL